MSEDRAPTLNQASVDFLNRFVPSSKERLFLAGSFPGQKRLKVVGYYSDERMLALPDNERHHVTAATFPEGTAGRLDAKATSVPFIVFDDVGKLVRSQDGATSISEGIEIDEDLFLFLPEPSWRIETRQGRFQYGYHFQPSLSPSIARKVLAALKRDPVLDKGLHAIGQYFRLPSGTNTKPDGKGFRTRLVATGPSWSLKAFVRGFKLDLATVTQAEATAAGVWAGEQLPPVAVGKLLELIPNDDLDYDQWVRVGHAIWGATGGCEDGKQLFLDWSAQSEKFDKAQDTAKTWDSFTAVKASASTLRVIIEERWGANSEQRQKAEAVFAGELFGEVNEADTAPDEAQAKLKFRELLAEIAKTQPVPTHHKANGADYDEHWLPEAGMLDIGGLASSLPIAPPVIFEPFVRGGLAVIGGAPSIGKSNLALNQALAVAAGRGDLIRGGVKLQFPGDVIYISNEDDLSVLRRRATAWATQHGVDLTTMPHKLILVRTSLFRKDAKDEWHVAGTKVLERVLEHCRSGADVAMLFVDTLGTSISGADEHHIKDMTPVMSLFKDLAVALWCAVAFLHHTTKEAWARGSADATLRSIATIRGSGGITGTYTRGATLIVAPNKQELEAHPDWAGKDLVVEFMAKANDGPEGFVAGYYLRALVEVKQISAEDGSRTEWRKEPVLVPFSAADFGSDLEILQRYVTTLRAHQGDIRVVERVGHTGSPSSVQKLLGVTNEAARTIIDGLVAAGMAVVVDVRDAKGNLIRKLKLEDEPY